MIKTLQIGDKELTLSNNLSWALIYKSQFGQDIIPAVMPILSAITKVLSEILKNDGDVSEFIKNLDSDAVEDALIELCAFQFVDFINVVWAFAKAGDDDTPSPERWVKEFDEFPLDVIAPAVFELLTKGLVSTKNLSNLRGKAGAKTSQSKK